MRWVMGALFLVSLIAPASMAQDSAEESLSVSPDPFDLSSDTQPVEKPKQPRRIQWGATVPTTGEAGADAADGRAQANPDEQPGDEVRFNWRPEGEEATDSPAPRTYSRFSLDRNEGAGGRSAPALKRPEQDFSRDNLGRMLDISPGDMPDGNGCTERDDGFGNTGRTCVYSKSVTTVNGVRQPDARYNDPTVNGIALDNSDIEAREFCRLEGFRSGRLLGPGGRRDETAKASGAAACTGGACVAAGRVDCFD